MTSKRWKLFWEAFILLQVTAIAGITTACSCYFTPAAIQVAPSYPSLFQWPQQKRNITRNGKLLFTQILAANTNNSQYSLSTPLRAWITKPSTIRKYRKAGEVVYSRNILSQWSSYSHLSHQQWQLRANRVHNSLNGKSNVHLPKKHLIIDTKLGRGAPIVVEHQLPEMEIQQQVTDDNQISWFPWGSIHQSKIEEFKTFTYVTLADNLGHTISNQQLQRWLADYPPLVDHFDKLVQRIRDKDTILAVTDGLYLEDWWASTGQDFMRGAQMKMTREGKF